MASTGSPAERPFPRRALLCAGGLTPLLALLSTRDATPAEYSSPAEVLDSVDRFEAEVAVRLRALSAGPRQVRSFVASLLADQERQRLERAGLRRRLRLPQAARQEPPAAAARDLASLRAAQETLVYAHAEGLPALADPPSVRMLARHMVELARHLTLIDLWIEAEERRG